jgi:hypothetical protein
MGEINMKLYFITALRRLVSLGSIFFIILFYQSLAIANEAANDKTNIPQTSTEIWQAIDQNISELNKTINENKLEEVHHRAFAIRDLVDALPDHSSDLSSDKLAQVKANIKYVDTLAKRLDASGDAKDKLATQDNFTKLQKILEAIRTNYSISLDKIKT